MTRFHSLFVLALFLILTYIEIWFLPGPVSPFAVGITAFLAVIVSSGEPGLRDFYRRYGTWRVRPGWYAFVLLFPFATVLAANLICLAFGLPFYAFRYDHPAFANFLPLFLYVLASLALGEEVAWRGYLLPQLQRHLNSLSASIFLGLVWSAAHIPSYLSGGPQQGEPFGVFALETVALTILMTWVFNNTGGSILIAILYHLLDNLALGPITPALTGAPPQIWAVRAGIMVLSAIAVVATTGTALQAVRPGAIASRLLGFVEKT